MVLRKTDVDRQEKIADAGAILSSASGRLALVCRDRDASSSSTYDAGNDNEQLGGRKQVRERHAGPA